MVTVTSPAATSGDVCEVITATGRLSGEWSGDTPLERGAYLDVEIEVSGPARVEYLDSGDAFEDGFDRTGNDRTTITGHIVDFDHQGILTLRLGSTFVAFEEVTGPPLGFAGQVRITTEWVTIYPTGI